MVGDSSVNTAHTLNASGASIGFAINGTTDGVENGQTVAVTIVNGLGVAVETFTTTVANNAWSVNVSPTNARALSDGNYTVTADVSNAAGTATARASQNVTVDETPPAPPGAALTIDSGSLNSDHITNVGALSLSGIESGATVEYSINGGATWTTSFTPVEGPNMVLVRQTDVAGNVSSATSFSFTLDTDKTEHVTLTAAAVINAAAAPTAAFTIAGLDDAVTAGTLSVTDGTHTVSTAVTNNGTFHLDVSSLTDGTITASFTATDLAGNPESASITATLDTDKTEHVTLTAAAVINAAAAPTAAFTIAGLDDAVTAGTLSVTDGTHTVSTAVTNNGTFHLDVSSLTDGTITASFTATDLAGNPESASITATLDTEVISGKTSGSVEIADDGPGSGRLTDTGTLTDTDVDNTFIAVTTATNSTGGYGVFTMTAAGVWTYTLKNSPNLGEGQHLTDTFTVHTVEGTAQVITITIGDFDTAPAGVAGSAINLGLTQLTGVGSEAVTVTGAPLNWTMTGATHNPDGSWTALTNDFSNLTITPDVNFVGATVLHVTETWTNSDGSMGSTILSDNVEAYAPASPIFAVAGDDHLTGTGSGDQFVFAQPIGNDIIYNFDAASDKIDLIGFSNIASFADIQGNIADDASGNAVINIGANETITINGVHAASVTASDFVFNQSPSTENPGTMQIGDGSHLPLSGTINNTGTIALSSTGDETDLQLIEHGVTLEGGGKILLSDSDANVISGTSSGVTLNNEDNTISGAGQLGNGELTLTNAGTIDATGTHALTIDTGSNLVTNSGVLEASGSGGMMVTSGIVNSGVLWANGATLTVQGAVSGNGTATIDGIGTLDFEASTSANVVFGSGTGGTLKLGDSFHFNGTISGFGGSDVIDLANVAAANASISYHENTAGTGGTLAISNGAQTLELSLLGHYSADNFSIVPDQLHGTSIIYVPHDLML